MLRDRLIDVMDYHIDAGWCPVHKVEVINKMYLSYHDLGGNWNNGANAGVFALNVNNRRSNANGNIGFRSALLRTSEGAALRGYAQYTKK